MKLTREKIMKMRPGKVMNFLMHLVVLGKPLSSKRTFVGLEFSSDMRHAMNAAEMVCKDGYELSKWTDMVYLGDAKRPDRYNFKPSLWAYDENAVSAETPALAICRSLLLVTLEKENDKLSVSKSKPEK